MVRSVPVHFRRGARAAEAPSVPLPIDVALPGTQIAPFSRSFDTVKKLDALNVVQKMTNATGLAEI